jgi:hypothetical protein
VSDHARPPRVTPINPNKRHGFIEPTLSPPEHLAPGSGNKFSYLRSHREVPSDSEAEDEDSEEESVKESDDELADPGAAESSSEEEDSEDEDEDEDDEDIELTEAPVAPIAPVVPEAPEAPEAPMSPQRSRSLSTISSNGSLPDILIEEITEDDIGYDSDTSVIFPCHCEDFLTDIEKVKEEEVEDSDDSYDWSSSESEESLVGDMEGLLLRHQRSEFEEAQRQKYIRKKKRWSKGGNHKRNHAQSIGSGESDTEDIVPLDDADVVGSSARRLRRRTDDLALRPRTSLLFEDPPREIEELNFLHGDGEVIDTDDELMLPPWMYPGMQVDSESDDDDEDNIPVIHLPPIRSRR